MECEAALKGPREEEKVVEGIGRRHGGGGVVVFVEDVNPKF